MKCKNTRGRLLPRACLILVLLLIHLASSAQTITVKGILKNEKGEALAGATLSIKGTATRAVTARIVIPTSERLFPILNTIALGPRSDQLYALSNSGFTPTPRLLIVDLPGGH